MINAMCNYFRNLTSVCFQASLTVLKIMLLMMIVIHYIYFYSSLTVMLRKEKFLASCKLVHFFVVGKFYVIVATYRNFGNCFKPVYLSGSVASMSPSIPFALQ
jgi:hypothetical protein